MEYISCINGNNIKDISIYKSNNDGDTCAHLAAKFGNNILVKELILKHPDILKLENNKGEKIQDLIESDEILNLIFDNKLNQNIDNTLLIIKLIDNNKLNLLEKLLINYPYKQNLYNSPLIYACKNNNIDAVKLFIKYNFDVNFIDNYEKTPLITSTYYNNEDIVKLLIDNKANITYGGAYNDNLPINIAITNKNNNILHLLLNNNKQFDIKDKYLNIPLYYALKSNKTKWISDANLKKIINNSDIYSENINGSTPMHYIEKYNYTDLIKKSKNSKKNLIKNIKMPSVQKTDIGKFNSDIIHNFIYTMIFLNRYPNLMIPFQKFDIDKQKNNLENIFKYNSFRDTRGTVITNILTLYTDKFFSFFPHLILWASNDIYYIPPIDINKLLESDNIRFIFFKLTIIMDYKSTHANILLYDKVTNELIRFEPYGSIDVPEYIHLNNLIKNIFNKLINNDIKYFFPEDYMNQTMFQTVSDDEEINNKKLGDPNGYCLAWIYWFLELRLNNPDKPLKNLIENAFNNILSKKTKYNQFLEYIRDYSARLNNDKNKLLLDAGIKKNDLYSLSYDNKRFDKIVSYLNKNFTNLIKKL